MLNTHLPSLFLSLSNLVYEAGDNLNTSGSALWYTYWKIACLIIKPLVQFPDSFY